MPHPSVFLSHNTKDTEFTARLAEDLRTAGATVHIVLPDQSGDFQDRINAALNACTHVVLVLTPDSLASKWVNLEINSAIWLKQQGRIKEILPIQAAKINQRAIPPLWGVLNIFDATYDRNYPVARDALLHALGLAPLSARPTYSTPARSGSSRKVDLVAMAAERVNRGRQYVWDGDYDAAVAALYQARLEDSENADAEFYLAEAYVNRGQADLARACHERRLQIADRQLALNVKSASAWRIKATSLNALGAVKEALAAFEQSLAFDATNAFAWQEKGKILRNLGRVADAEEAEQRAKELRK